MRKVPNRDSNGNVIKGEELEFNAIIAQFIISPSDVKNNMLLTKLRHNLELTIDYTMAVPLLRRDESQALSQG